MDGKIELVNGDEAVLFIACAANYEDRIALCTCPWHIQYAFTNRLPPP